MPWIGTPPAGAGMPGSPPMYRELETLRTKTLSSPAKMSFSSSLRPWKIFVTFWCIAFAPASPCGMPGGRSWDGKSLAKY